MKKTIMKKWVAALRSGDYTQAQGSLLSKNLEGDSHCCLGVLCDLAEKAGKGSWDGYFFMDKQFQSTNSWLPPGIMKWTGVKTEHGAFSASVKSLVGLNDAHTSFTELADIIEANYKDL